MRTFRQYMYLALAIAVAGVLGAGVVRAAYDQGDRDQGTQYQTDRDRYAEDRSGSDRSGQYQTRNVQLERQIARQLRDEGLGEQGEIMILATGNRVILLGNVPDDDSKDLAGRAAKQVPGVSNIDNRLHVVKEAKQLSDMQLERSVDSKLPDRLARTVQVQAQNGTVTLQGSVSNWRDAADAIDAAFASGAQQVNSQLTVGTAGAGRYGAGTAGGYAPGARGQAMTGRELASSSDLNLAQQVAQQLRQELPSGQNIQVVRPMSIYVTVKNGTATLHGYVRDTNQKQQAEQIASSVSGIQNVTNDLAIFSGAGTMGRMGGQGEYGQGATGMGSEGMAGTQMSTADRRTAQQIQQHLQDQFPDANIRVTARQGTVTLRGTVSDSNEKQQAEQVAQSFPGVQNVQNNLTISGQAGQQGGAYPPQGYIPGQQGMSDQGNQGMSSGQMGGQQGMSDQGNQGMSSGQMGPQGAMSASDFALARQVAQRLQQQLSGIRNVQVERPGTIYVMATQGTVMLHGFAADRNIKQQATTIARAIPGVRNVENTLTISAGAAASPSYGYIPGQPSQMQPGITDQNQVGTSGQAGASQQLISSRGQSAQGTARSKAYGSSSADRSKATKIEQKLQSQIPDADITVIVSGAYATLWGTVPNAQAKQQAAQIAKSISGVRTVTNNLTVGGQPATAGMGGMNEPYGSQANAGAPYTQIAYTDEGVADQNDQESQIQTAGAEAKAFGTSAADLAKAQQIQQSLHSQLPDADITVTVSGNNVTLWGTAPDAQEKQQAKQIAQSASGMSNVTDKLTIGSQQGASEMSDMGDMGAQQPPTLRFVADAGNDQTAMTPADISLAQRVAQLLQEQLHGVSNVQIQIMRPNTIYILASKGNITLDGVIPDKNTKDSAEKLAKAVPGVKGVKNSLTVGATTTSAQAGEQRYGGQTARSTPPQTAPQGGEY